MINLSENKSRAMIVASVIITFIITTTVSGAPPLDSANTLNHVGISKKDMFMSRGWGASGMPFSMFYVNNYARSLQHEQNMQQEAIARNRKKVASRYVGGKLGKTNENGMVTGPIKSNNQSQARQNKTYPPQLFVSNGWGPMG